MLKVLKVTANNDYTLSVELSNGKRGLFDVKPYLQKGVFVELKDLNCFKKVQPYFVGVAWQTGQDLSADTIAHNLQEV